MKLFSKSNIRLPLSLNFFFLHVKMISLLSYALNFQSFFYIFSLFILYMNSVYIMNK